MADATGRSLISTIREWPIARKISLAVVAALSIGLFALIIFEGRVADFRLLYANLSSADASAVIEWLHEQKIPYRLEDGGKAVHIPADKVYESRIALAGAGIPQGGGIGFEIFDKQSFGLTDFAQKVNYQRALQGELARTIGSLAPVEGARVLLALPEKRVFKEQQKEATASVIVKLRPGQQLKENQVQGVIHLVASSIEGLDPKNVTVVDANGMVLSTTRQEDQNDPMSPDMLSFQQAIERRLETRAQSLLDRALGVSSSLVRVTATIDFSRAEKTEELYDPKSAVARSEQVSTEKSAGSEGGAAGGVPGVQSNLQGSNVTASAANTNTSNRTSETTNYEINKVVNRVIAPVGTVKNVSVAVLVGDRLVPAAEGKEATTSPRSEQEMQSIESMVKSALGLDATRGDQIKVVSMPFENDFSQEAAAATPTGTEQLYKYLPYVKYGLLVLGAGLIYFFLVRPLIRTMSETSRQVKTVQELEADLTGQEKLLAYTDPTQRMRSDILKSETPPTHVIRSWLSST